ncbi:hypothetical protein POM88_042360 [Heracleum sosnowskyi]|uniref:P-type ATPase A domain-containing protein n=1 Tax=Heracleum sosnowskyi TaxID=360622 RepID=A0AAD8MBK1_9APIA|nr:hypothetical protein POM88_042360 [Heracleum sosnowskyi]
MESLDLENGYRSQSGNAAVFKNQQARGSEQDVEYKGQVYTAIRDFCICFTAVGMLVELVVMCTIQHREFRDVIDNLLVLLTGCVPIAMSGFLPSTMILGYCKIISQGVLREGRWSDQDAAILVPEDIVPANAHLLEGYPLKIDQSALTGESFPVTRKPYDEVFSDSTCKKGEIEDVVIANRVHPIFGKAARLVDRTNQVGLPEGAYRIGNFCICYIAVGMYVGALVALLLYRKYRDVIGHLLYC